MPCSTVYNIGSLNWDYVYTVSEFVHRGQTIAAQDLEKHSGGKGLNQSLALARAGASVVHIGAVGETLTDGLVALLANNQVQTSGICALPGVPTGHAIIQRTPSGENCIIIYGGANQALTPEMVEQGLAPAQPGDWLLVQNETSCLIEALVLAHKKGMRIAFNPSPCSEALRALPLNHIDLFFVNEDEAQTLTDYEEGVSRDAPFDPGLCLERLHECYPHAEIVMTVGAQGAYVVSAEGEQFYSAAPHVHAVDTTGAGDTFTGYYLASKVAGHSIVECLNCAVQAASLSVQVKGAANSIPQASEVARLLAL